jgi:hypothetical protein
MAAFVLTNVWNNTAFLGGSMRILTDFVFLILFFFLVFVWLMAWLAFHIAAGGIHLLLVLAVIFLVIHLVRGGPAV